MIEIRGRESDERLWEYFLRKKFRKKKAKLKALVKLLILTAVAEEAKKEVDAHSPLP